MKKSENKMTLGDRMKRYESVTRIYLMPRGYACLRVDGRCFHQYTKGLKKPFDKDLMNDMDATTIYLCENIQNAKVGYVQSDEISILMSCFDQLDTQMFFDGNIQKISSVVASMTTSKFNRLRWERNYNTTNSDISMAEFDCRVWNIPNHLEAYNTFVWRQQDAIRNSISSVSQSLFSHKQLHGKSQSDMHEMLHGIGVNWATDYTDGEKNGRIIVKENYESKVEWVADKTNYKVVPQMVERTRWVSKDAWVFTKDEGKLLDMIPKYE